MPKQKILPFFIPMEGCPQKCIYCDQVAISGKAESPTAKEIKAAIAEFPPDSEAEIAFYGGSFTCLSEDRQLYYLRAVQEAIAENKIGGIRISTRPDAIDKDVCSFLSAYGVRTVELGIQSFDQQVLTASRRGYTAEQAREACQLITEAKMRLGIQLMTGLPEDTAEKSLDSVSQSIEAGAKLLRIYPTLVLTGTTLAVLHNAGKYRPQTLAEAVECCRDMLIAAKAASLTVIRIGINPSAEVEKALLAGPYHPAFGGLVKEAMKKAQIISLLAEYDPKLTAVLFFPRADQPLVFGHNRAAMIEYARNYPSLAFIADDKLPSGMVKLVVGGKSNSLSEEEFCRNQAAR